MLLDLGLAQAFEVLHDIGPFKAVPGGGEAILEFLAQDESEERTEDVAADGLVVFVEDRAGREQRFGGAEDVLDRSSARVSAGRPAAVSVHSTIGAVEQRIEGDAAVDLETAAGCEPLRRKNMAASAQPPRSNNLVRTRSQLEIAHSVALR